MLVQIHTKQIPAFWEAIKYAAIRSDDIKEEYWEYYSLELLQDLLAGKKTCFVAQEGNQILFIIIIEFQINKMTGMKFLNFNNLYSFQTQADESWKEVFTDLYKIAVSAECKAIIGDSDNDRIGEINLSVGALCTSKKYIYFL